MKTSRIRQTGYNYNDDDDDDDGRRKGREKEGDRGREAVAGTHFSL